MNPNLPTFSIIVPTYNRPRQLARCLSSIRDLDYPRDRLEVLVVDDGSTRSLVDVVGEYKESVSVKLERTKHRGPAAARNTGAGNAKGEYLVFIDDDCMFSRSWVRFMVTQFKEDPGCAATGRTKNLLTRNIFAKASQILIDFLYAYYNADPLHSRFFTSNNLAMPAKLFHEVGGFDTAFPCAAGEDRDLCDRLIEADRQVVYNSEAIVFHAHEMTIQSFLRQHFYYGRAAYHYWRLKGLRQQTRIKVEPLRFYFELLGHPFETCRGVSALFLSTMMILTQIANTTGFLWGAGASHFRRGRK